jgi:GAF domain-containing protein
MRRLQQVSEFLTKRGADETEDGILSQAINLLYGQFGYTSAQFYLLDESGRLERRTHTGLGPELVSARQTLTLDAASAISEAARTRSPVTVTPADNPIRRSHFLPASTAGLSVPLLSRERVIGVLDVQSDTLSRFNEVQTATLELLANPIALLLSQARDREIARRDVQEQGQIIASLRGQLQQLRQAGREDISSMWEEYLQQRGNQPSVTTCNRRIAGHR